MREIKLSGGEITVLKLLGLSGTPISGKQLIERANELEPAEFLDTLDGLLSMGYVMSSKVNIRLMEDVEHAFFRVNAAHARDLREAINPSRRRERDRSRRRRG
jgi:hypothetical protein